MKPWINESIVENGKRVKDNFKDWFGPSKVVDATGQPMVMYHGTFSDFNSFKNTRDVGFHFGTAQAANDRLKKEAKKPKNRDSACFILPVFLSIRNPAVVSDLCTWPATALAKELVAKGYLRDDQAQPVLQSTDSQNWSSAGRSFFEHIVEALDANGYDGLKYRNLFEGRTRNIKSLDLSEFIEVVENEGYGKGSSSKLTALFKDIKYPVGGAKGDTPEAIMQEVKRVLARRKTGFDFSWIAFRPEQVKNAVGNTGIYSTVNPDISDRRAQSAQQALDWIKSTERRTAPHA